MSYIPILSSMEIIGFLFIACFSSVIVISLMRDAENKSKKHKSTNSPYRSQQRPVKKKNYPSDFAIVDTMVAEDSTVQRYIDQYEKSEYKNRIFGLPGKDLSYLFGEAGRVGAHSEIKTARILNSITANFPGIAVFHNLHINGKYTDIDHVIFSEKSIIIIDNKKWEAEHEYTLKRDKYIKFGITAYKDDAGFQGSDIYMLNYLREWRYLFPDNDIYGVISVESHNSIVKENLLDIPFGFVHQDKLKQRIEYLLRTNFSAREDIHYESTDLNTLITWCFDVDRYVEYRKMQ